MAKQVAAADVKKIVIACEAGMGSSLMVTNKLKKKVKAANLDIEVSHTPARAIPEDAQVVVVHFGPCPGLAHHCGGRRTGVVVN